MEAIEGDLELESKVELDSDGGPSCVQPLSSSRSKSDTTMNLVGHTNKRTNKHDNKHTRQCSSPRSSHNCVGAPSHVIHGRD